MDGESRGKKGPKVERLGGEELVLEFITKLKRGELSGGNNLSVLTIELLRTIISRKRMTTVDELLADIHHVGHLLVIGAPQELVIGNIVRRTLRIIREEGKGLVNEVKEEEEKEQERQSYTQNGSNSSNGSPYIHPHPHGNSDHLLTMDLNRQQSPSPPPSSSTLKKSFSTVNIDPSLSLHKLLDQPAQLTIHERDGHSHHTHHNQQQHQQHQQPHPHTHNTHHPIRTPLSPTASNASTASSPVLPSSSPSLSAASSSSSFSSTSSSGFSSSSSARQKHKLDREEEKRQRDWLTARLKPHIIEELGLLLDEVKAAESIIAEQAIEHIYAKETIMTFGYSRTVIAFLKEAAKVRRFEVVIAEACPSMSGTAAARVLASPPHPIETTLITDSAVFAMMPAVNKVIIGTHAVMANGGLISWAGGHNIAVAARHHSVPFVVLTGLHKLAPLYPFDQDTFNQHHSPAQIIHYEDSSLDAVHVENPAYDYITPDLVTLFITNLSSIQRDTHSYIFQASNLCGGHNPSYIYRLLADHYHPLDYTFQAKEGTAAISTTTPNPIDTNSATSTPTAAGAAAAATNPSASSSHHRDSASTETKKKQYDKNRKDTSNPKQQRAAAK